MKKYCLGKLPATPHYGLKLNDYLKHSELPALPVGDFGHGSLVKDWGMLGNGDAPDNPSYAPHGVGDCAIAGPFHATQLWCTEGQKPFSINTECTLEMYSAITGYDPKAYNPKTDTNPTDNGSSVQDVAEYWRRNGLKDAAGNVHKIQCYMALEPGNVEQLWQAMYLFGAVGIGIELPAEYQYAFAYGNPWDAVESPNIEGGHYVLGVGRRSGDIDLVTWGKNQLFTPAGYEQFSDEAFVYFDQEMLLKGVSLEGFDSDKLMADMADLANETGYEEPLAPGEAVCK